ncbi:hypothetical protein [Gilvibacter sp.]|uniref:hypothetical protein n=1 Tax=Gilvibacter sp. TaxID=2729997 RepID=UPI003F49C80A
MDVHDLYPIMILLDNPKKGEESLDFVGKIRVFDGFHTGKMMELFVKVKQQYCENHQSVQVLFILSPNSFEKPIWNELDAVTFKESACDLN